jgi:LacI family transcriptional regulator
VHVFYYLTLFKENVTSQLKNKSYSLVDIAKKLNISTTTVSFILNGKAEEKRISNALKEKVLQFVEEVNYKPNLLARSFRTGKTNIIGLMVEDISNSFFANFARLIEEKAYKNGYRILYCSTGNEPEKARELLQMFKEQRVDGYIITPTDGIKEEIAQLVKTGVPIILFDRKYDNIDHDYVELDNYQSAFDAVSHLVSNGFKDIGFITINSLQSQMQQRLAGYEAAIEKYGLKSYVKELSFNLESNSRADYIIDFLRRKKSLDAVFFATNYLCISGLKAIQELKLSIPKDLAVVSFDDHIAFELHNPPITTITQPIESMAESLINMLLDKLAFSNQQLQQVTLPGQLIIRNSSGKKRK